MRSANTAATDAAAWMHAAGDQASQDSAAGAPTSADSATGGNHMDDDPEIEVVYSGQSNSSSDLKSPARSSRKAAGAKTTTAEPCGSLDPKNSS